jgi:hypothetical protein
MTLKFLLAFQRRPIVFFGGLGASLMGLSLIAWLYLAVLYLATNTQKRPRMLVTGVALLSGMLIVLVDLLGELVRQCLRAGRAAGAASRRASRAVTVAALPCVGLGHRPEVIP